MRYLSLFSGIEAATQAWHPLGWECVGVSEIEPFPCAVLAHHYPDVPNLGDVTKITEDDIKKLGQIDLVVFGFPCQDLSVAGGRKGFQGERSSLFYDAIRVIEYAKRHCGTRFALLENVPGAFSSNKGADFTEVVKHMAGLDDLDTPTNGWGKEGAALGSNGLLEWSVLDAQWFGLAQRRKRVFAIVDFGDWTSRPPILLERESLRGDSAPSRETRESVTADVRGCTASSINFRAFGARVESELVGTLTATDYKEPHGVMIESKAVYLFDSLASNSMKSKNPHSGCRQVELAKCLDTSNGCPSKNQGGLAVVAIAGNIIGRTEGNGGNGNGFDESGACYTLTTNDRHAVALAFKERAGCAGGGKGFLGKEECAFTLSTVKDQSVLTPKSVVRRLTPIECEKLQGFKPIIEGVTYKLCLDHQSKSARVEVKCHRSQSSVLGVDTPSLKSELLQIAKIVEASFSTSPTNQNLLAVQGVPQHCGISEQKKPNVEKLKSNASGVEQEDCYRHQIAIEDFAPELVATLQTLVQDQRLGKEGSQANITPFTHRGNGSSSVEIFGLDIEASAEDAILDLNGEKYTMSGLGQNTLMTGCEIATLFYCATNAIGGCIPRKTNKEIFYIHLTNVSGFTKIPYRNKSADDCPNGVRYKALGNSMAVNVMAWIGQRVQQATAIKVYGSKA